MGKSLTAYRLVYGICLLAFAIFLGIKIHSGQWLQTDLQGLLPQEQHWNPAQRKVDHQQEATLNRQFVVLVGHQNANIAFATAQKIQHLWQQHALFSKIEHQLSLDLPELQQAIHSLSFATLPQPIRQQLLTDPERYFQQYAQYLVDPFSQNPLLPLEKDWLGFGRFVLEQGKLFPRIEWNSENGMLYITEKHEEKQAHNPPPSQPDITWVLLRGELTHSNLLNGKQELLDLVTEQQQIAKENDTQLLTASASLFAAHAKSDAEKESLLMSSLGISLTLLLLFATFKTLRILWLFLPILSGMMAGISATVLYFGQIHILTLVVGTSLIGVLIDFPLHWLSSSLFASQWQAQQAMHKLKFSFLISLIVTLLGYALLGFTALPVLQQTALFSGIALIVAISFTLLYLPPLFRHYQPRKRSNPLEKRQFSLSPNIAWLLGFGLLIFVGTGIYKSKWQDDIRQWVAMPSVLTDQLQRISQITGLEFGSQYFLITAKNSDELLQKSQQISTALNSLQQQGVISGYQSLSQWFMPQQEQKKFASQLAQRITMPELHIFTEIGIPTDPMQQQLKNLPNQPLVSLEQGLKTPFGQAWQSLYIGEITPNQVAGIVKLSGVTSVAPLAELANQQDIFWQDKRSHLNQSFQQTRNQAGWLKALSFLLAGALLWRLFGLKPTAKILAVPFTAILIVIAIFGYLSQPIGLFTMFGLLLVSAISIDYTAYMHTADEPIAHKRVAILLAGLTTMISFVLLGFSSTPAVATFGLSVSLGVALSLFITFKLFK